MKKLLLAVLLLVPSLSQAELNIIDTLKNVPSTKHGVAYDAKESKINYITTFDVLKKGDFSLGAGYSSDNKVVATVSYNLGGLKKLGIDTPITNLVELNVGAYAGFGRLTGSNEFSAGPQVTIISVKF